MQVELIPHMLSKNVSNTSLRGTKCEIWTFSATAVWLAYKLSSKWCRLNWLGHVFCMDTDSLPQQTLFGELANVKCNRGHPRLHFTDACQHDLKLFWMDAEWEMMPALGAETAQWQLTL